jgi:hypothetical protein
MGTRCHCTSFTLFIVKYYMQNECYEARPYAFFSTPCYFLDYSWVCSLQQFQENRLSSGTFWNWCVKTCVVWLQSLAVGQAAYNCMWYERSTDFKRLVLTVLAGAQKPIHITLGKIMPVSIELLASVSNSLNYELCKQRLSVISVGRVARQGKI